MASGSVRESPAYAAVPTSYTKEQTADRSILMMDSQMKNQLTSLHPSWIRRCGVACKIIRDVVSGLVVGRCFRLNALAKADLATCGYSHASTARISHTVRLCLRESGEVDTALEAARQIGVEFLSPLASRKRI